MKSETGSVLSSAGHKLLRKDSNKSSMQGASVESTYMKIMKAKRPRKNKTMNADEKLLRFKMA